MELENSASPPSTIMGDSHMMNMNQSNLSVKELIEEKDALSEGNIITKQVVKIRSTVYSVIKTHWTILKIFLKICFSSLVVAYTAFVVYHWHSNGQNRLNWCKGNGMFLLIIIFIAFFITYNKIIKPFLLPCIDTTNSKYFNKFYRILKIAFLCIAVIGLIFFLIIDTEGSRSRLYSAGGLAVFILLGVIFSKYPNQIKWKTVLVGICVQFLIGMLVIRWEVGRTISLCIGGHVETFLNFGRDGAAFVYSDFLVNKLNVFAFQSLSVIFFINMIIEVLFYYGWLQTICYKLGSLVQIVLGTTIIESVNAVTSVFLGLSEAPLLYKPYIKDLTSSEMHAVMAGGFSTAAGSVFAAYAALGVQPHYIITASVMAAPAALCFAKLLYPETEASKTSITTFIPYKSEEKTVIDAASKGAVAAINLVMRIIAIVIACVSLITFLNSLTEWFGLLVGVEGFTFEYMIGKLLIPVTYTMGVHPDQCGYVAKLIGIKITVNEFVAYQELGKMKAAKLLTPRSEAMATFALCSFANPCGIGCFNAILIGLCPSQSHRINEVTFRAFISGITTSLLTSMVAGVLMPEEGFDNCVSCVTETPLSSNITEFLSV